jgi:hypothetical protein
MRSHFLKDLPINGKESILAVQPSFDFYILRQVTRFRWEMAPNASERSPAANLELTAIYENSQPFEDLLIKVRCLDVRQVVLPVLGPSFFLGELEIEDVSGEQIEGVRWRVKDFGPDRFVILCKEIEMMIDSPAA